MYEDGSQELQYIPNAYLIICSIMCSTYFKHLHACPVCCIVGAMSCFLHVLQNLVFYTTEIITVGMKYVISQHFRLVQGRLLQDIYIQTFYSKSLEIT